MSYNPCLLTDSYAVSQPSLYPPKMTWLHSYLSSRGGPYQRQVFFGLRPILKKYFEGVVVTKAHVDEARDLYDQHFSHTDVFHDDEWMHVVRDHGGRLPLHIKAIPEGTVLGPHNVWMTVESTCPACAWMAGGAFEPLFVHLWHPITAATRSRRAKEYILHYLHLTGDPSAVHYKLHDFGFRGSAGVEAAQMAGAAHLVNFWGTDTVPALPFIRDNYGLACAGYSVPATNHSVKTTWGRERERSAVQRYLERYPHGIIADVGDSYDIRHYVSEVLGSLKAEILGRDGLFAVRPDTEEPHKIVLEITERLARVFGTQEPDGSKAAHRKGYKLLHPKVSLVHGDGYDGPDDIDVVLRYLCSAGWSADNVTFGMGGGLHQKFDRDTLKVAYKASCFREDGLERHAYKEPVGQTEKNSMRGTFAVVHRNAEYRTIPLSTLRQGEQNFLATQFLDGVIAEVPDGFSNIRIRSEAGLRMNEYAPIS